MNLIPLSEVKDNLSKFLKKAEKKDYIITRHGKPAGILKGFKNDDDWFEYRLHHDPKFLERIENARAGLKRGEGKKLEEL